MRSTFKVLFYLKKNAPKKNGSVPVMCRITIDGTIAQFSCKCDIHPDLWDIKSNRASGKSTVALETNRFLDKIRVGINAKYKEIAERDNYVTAEKVKNAFLGLEMRHETLLKVFAQHNEDFSNRSMQACDAHPPTTSIARSINIWRSSSRPATVSATLL